jgi:hypothetical protein
LKNKGQEERRKRTEGGKQYGRRIKGRRKGGEWQKEKNSRKKAG